MKKLTQRKLTELLESVVVEGYVIGLDLSNTDLNGLDFCGYKFKQCNFSGSDMSNTTIRNCGILNCNFTKAKLDNGELDLDDIPAYLSRFSRLKMRAFLIRSTLLLFRYASEKSTPNKSQAANEQSPMVARFTFTVLILASSNTELFMLADVNSAPSKLAPSNDERYILDMITSRFFILALQKEQFQISAARIHALFIVVAIKLHPVILALMKSALFKQELSNKTFESVLPLKLIPGGLK